MPAPKIYVGFISHAWNHRDDYDDLTQMLAIAPNFNFCNLSLPRTDPIGVFA
ncbi:hypothetical protein LMG9673_04566 [Ralstonia pseudosolanacearum]|nr:hypothetical protein LMG9673_04566 [Ralstonia pseudosolanacearum]